MAGFAYKSFNRPVRARWNLQSMRTAPAMSYPGFHDLPGPAGPALPSIVLQIKTPLLKGKMINSPPRDQTPNILRCCGNQLYLCDIRVRNRKARNPGLRPYSAGIGVAGPVGASAAGVEGPFSTRSPIAITNAIPKASTNAQAMNTKRNA